MRTFPKSFRSTAWILLSLVILLALLLMSAPAQSSAQLSGASGSAQQIGTPTPTAIDPSEVGSTDGIVIIGFAIVGIVIVPVLIHWKDWSQKEKSSG